VRRVVMVLACLGLVCGFGFGLAGCGFADSQVTFIPDRFKQKAPEPPHPDERPDVTSLARDRTAELFSGKIDSIAVSQPTLSGLHWQFCARPSGHGVGGQVLSAQTYLIQMENNVVGDRQAVDHDHWCNRESFSAVTPKST
jgi:hypothetical protein